LFPANYAGLVDVHAPDQIARAIVALVLSETGEGFRDIFIRHFTLERHLLGLAEAFQQVEQTAPAGIGVRVKTPA
jgi:hypothetical protein